MRLIDADKLCIWTALRPYCSSDVCCEVTDIIDNAPTVNPYKWVACDEGLPQHTDEYNVTVGVASEFGYFEKVTTLRFERIEGREPQWVIPKNKIYNVIAWMPLPSAYKEQHS